MVCGGARGGNLSVKKSGRVTSVLLYWQDWSNDPRFCDCEFDGKSSLAVLVADCERVNCRLELYDLQRSKCRQWHKMSSSECKGNL
jgi:hypothetical protein